jgi:hypothetical protein
MVFDSAAAAKHGLRLTTTQFDHGEIQSVRIHLSLSMPV